MVDIMRNKKILLSAFACQPNKGSEPYVGWSWAQHLAKVPGYEVHVITREFHKSHISSDNNDIVFHYYDVNGAEIKDHRWKYIKPYYVVWQLFLLNKVKKLNREHNYDVIHHVTYNNIDVPGFLWLINGPKFIWGSVGGGQCPPLCFYNQYSTFGKLKQLFRFILKKTSPLSPLIYFALKNAHHVFYANQDTEFLLRKIKHDSSRMLETAINEDRCISLQDLNEINKIKSNRIKGDNCLNILWIGWLEERKALKLALDSLKKIDNSVSFKFSIIGDGPLRDSIYKYSIELGFENEINFLGQVEFNTINTYLNDSDLFLFTSVQDTSGNVVLEAMSQGIPVVALNHQGVKEMINCNNNQPRGGLLADYYDYHSAVENISKHISKLYKDDAIRSKLSLEARENILDNHLWRSRIKNVIEIY